MKIRAFAKINLALDVVSERDDGYHELKMIMAPITLHDLITIEVTDKPGIILTTNSSRVPTDERNIMYKVAQAVMEKYKITKGIKMHCMKHIPSQAGLAGGSADGAAVIKAMNRLFKLHMSYEDMVELTKDIGSDIPFCIYNRLAVVSGKGEQFEFIHSSFNTNFLLVKPSRGVSTKRSFNALDMSTALHPDIYKMKAALIHEDYQGVVDTLGNTLEEPSIDFVPEIATIKKEMLELGFDGALMSGSGSCVFGMTNDEEILHKGYEYFKESYYFVRTTKLLSHQD
ncbi:MAG TPA: 4-(cytidine 5'-diphospho)-2-C-methyl-D-erythritol kinase [Erysipelotrichaceae bacterium]|uniref:4-(cytidine 5'-diphospho)-2-C-methyl-D-erythritol kinase n=2 Tax=Sharpea TaxID=519427 RepID=UPI000ECB59FA|nr:4-(cytidine 5'-diphospho)-2-C-methyl-D-erythritol kinase [uncultured Sharpea sp.]HAJ15110.1 4-(cytidine 5'-diphospho)-2-C-methyl-D-erythritol kinase [Erysipelotrichaceae bacterium]HBZ89287.1 4-(cytidine 5'-diphospho)-2-C-methyl-D-erythritol kinase [Erysipelotrichaceae bacterium]HCG97414.1 4-(cytidine 5'-diphospho)-2-C-methyl-D-erythritol kinase [Erysipelotrichaceae bacterium]HCJ37960.1 4-(cytidine 5'-diphospho)-2-C-methyl-D-erythritol kinase [Erysipelotrichaceae bacterium]